MKCLRLSRFLKKRLYNEETGFLLNYLTLRISDPLIVKEKDTHRGNQFERFVNPVIIFSLCSLLMTIYGLYVDKSPHKSGNPMMMVTGGLTLLLTLGIKFLVTIGRATLCQHLAVPYLLIHTIGTVCTFKGWVPESFSHYPKDVMQW
jgi:hypothetical protein